MSKKCWGFETEIENFYNTKLYYISFLHAYFSGSFFGPFPKNKPKIKKIQHIWVVWVRLRNVWTDEEVYGRFQKNYQNVQQITKRFKTRKYQND